MKTNSILLVVCSPSGYFPLEVLGRGPSEVRYPEVVSQVANNLLVLVACCTDALSLSVQVLSSCRNTTEVLDVSRRSIVTQPFCFELVLLLATWRSTGVSSYSEVARIFVITNGCVVPIRKELSILQLCCSTIFTLIIQYL